MDAYSNNFQKMFLVKNSCDCNQIRSNQIAGSVSTLKNYQKDISKRPDIKKGERYQLVRRYNVSNTSVIFRYQLKCLWDMLSCSVLFRYHLVRRYDASNWLVLFTYQWDVAKTFQIGPFCWYISWDVVMMSQYGPRRPNWSLEWVNFLWVLGSTLLWHLRWAIPFKVPAITLLQLSKMSVLFRYQLWRLCNVLSSSVSLRYELVHCYDVSSWSYLRANETSQRSLK